MRLTPLIVVIFFASCSGRDELPDGVLSSEKMEAVLWDLTRADVFTESYIAIDTAKNVDSAYIALYSQVLDIHDITKETMSRSMNFYQQRPDLLKPIFDSLSERRMRLAPLPPSRRKAPDSAAIRQILPGE